MTARDDMALTVPGPPAASRTADAHTLARTIDRIYREHHRRVFHLALRYGAGDSAWAEDVVHDVFVTLLDQLPRLREHEELGAWLYRVTTNRCYRKQQRERFLDRPWIRACLRAFGEPSTAAPEGQVFARQDLERTRVALRRIPAKQRVVVCMHLLDGRSQVEIGEVLGLSKSYVCKLLARGMKSVQEELES